MRQAMIYVDRPNGEHAEKWHGRLEHLPAAMLSLGHQVEDRFENTDLGDTYVHFDFHIDIRDVEENV